MDKTSVTCSWLDGMAFETEINGHKIILDAHPDVGGNNRGPRPKPLILSSLAGCSGMDVISILRKMKAEPSWFNMVVEGELTEDHPKWYRKIHIIYQFKKADALDEDKVSKAVSLSQDRYCGVNALLKRACEELTHEIQYLD